MWQSSCARMASNWGGVRRSAMPSGGSRTGLTIPTTPGSRRAVEDITCIGRFKGSGFAARRTARIRRHHRSQKTAPIATPQSQTPKRMAGNGFRASSRNHRKRRWGRRGKGLGDLLHHERKPRLRDRRSRWPYQLSAGAHSNGKGIRNFTEAASQIQYRTAARFVRSASVNSQATAAQRVDCQRWLANGDRSAKVIALCPFRKGETRAAPSYPVTGIA